MCSETEKKMQFKRTFSFSVGNLDEIKKLKYGIQGTPECRGNF